MYIVFDTETTGLPTSWNAPCSDIDSWPRLVQLAWETFDGRGHKKNGRCQIVRPIGFTIPADAAKIHGISTARAHRAGIPIAKVLDEFVAGLRGASVLVAHNLQFDVNVVGAELHRVGVRDAFHRKMHLCTMRAATEFCALPGRYGFKWPKLAELHFKLFGKSVRETHDAGKDVATCSKCFFELKRLGVLRVTSTTRR